MSYRKKKNTQIHEVLQFSSSNFHILKSSHDSLLLVVIIYCQCKYNYFILLSLNNIFVFMHLGLYIVIVFIKYFKLNDKTQPHLHYIIINPHNYIHPYINNTLTYYLIVG